MGAFKIFLATAVFAAVGASPLLVSPEQGNELSLEDNIAKYIQRQEIAFEIPYVGSEVTLAARNLDEDQLDFSVKLSNGEARRSSKLKKIFAPILVLVILKAITLIPLALGILSLKTWNALQLSFVTFIISISLAVFQFCKKVSFDHAHFTHSAPWQAARSFVDSLADDDDAQDLAYSAYRQ